MDATRKYKMLEKNKDYTIQSYVVKEKRKRLMLTTTLSSREIIIKKTVSWESLCLWDKRRWPSPGAFSNARWVDDLCMHPRCWSSLNRWQSGGYSQVLVAAFVIFTSYVSI